MVEYNIFKIDVDISSSQSDMVRMTMDGNILICYFIIPHIEDNFIEIKFQRAEIIRVLDEMALSTEYEDDEIDGIIPENLAYVVSNSSFWRHQSEAFKINYPNARHYRFITGWKCVDVISVNEPTVSITKYLS